MSVREYLDKLCAQFSACNVVAYADLTTGMVLCHSACEKLPQEQLDDLCRTAADLLTGQLAVQFALHLPTEDKTNIQSAVLIGENSLELFLRADSSSSEALCCDCNAQIDLSAFTHAAHRVLAALSALP